MLTNGDKLVVTKKVAAFLDEGDIVQVTNVSDDGIISFAFGDNFMHMGVMNTAECESHFKKVEEKTEIPSITEEYIAEIMENSEFDVRTVFDKCTVVTCKLPNGFVITEYSSCVNPEDYSRDVGTNICFNKIKSKIWELEAYRLQQWLWEEETWEEAKQDYCPCCCDDCDECEYDDDCDECDDTDCDECSDVGCMFNTSFYM